MSPWLQCSAVTHTVAQHTFKVALRDKHLLQDTFRKALLQQVKTQEALTLTACKQPYIVQTARHIKKGQQAKPTPQGQPPLPLFPSPQA